MDQRPLARRAFWAYQALLLLLALATVWLITLPEAGWVETAHLAIWGVFVVD